MPKKILVIAGPTGSGESTITKELIKRYPIFVRLVSATTRLPRLNEKDKVDYYFFTEDDFKKKVTRGEIIEYSFVPGRSVYYGTYKPDLEKKLELGNSIIVNPDVVGARYYKKNFDATTIFIKTESVDILKDRLVKRDPSISKEELERRLEAAKYELENEESFYDYVLVNKDGDLEGVIEKVFEILKKEGYSLN